MESQTHLSSGTLSPDRASRPRYPLQRKIVLWTMAMVVVPLLACAVWSNTIARRAIAAQHARNVTLLDQTLAAALSDRLRDGWTSAAGDVVDGLTLDNRLAFVAVLDREHRVLHRRTVDADAWTSYEKWVSKLGLEAAAKTDGPVALSDMGDLVVRSLPVWSRPLKTATAIDDPQDRALLGFVVLALRERSMPETLNRLTSMQLLAVCVMCLITLPTVVLSLRYWTRPLRALHEATIRVTRGEPPIPVEVHARDEIGQLAEAFNRMVHKLWTAQAQLQQANTHLEDKVRDRTADIERVNHRLELEIKDKDEFLRAVSHDLNAPLRNISGLASMLLMKYRADLAEDALKKLERINANAKTQADLIGELLELSKLRTRPSKREMVDLNAVAQQVVDNLNYDLEKSGMTVRIARPLPTVYAERSRMRQLFQNLIDNAVKYTMQSPTRQVTLDWSLDDSHLHFTVSDTGCGIAQQDIPNLFQVFRRATHSNSHHVPGKGVGLASVKAIIEGYGGQIWIQSQLNQGTTIHFTLDRKNIAVPEGSGQVAE